MHPDESATYYTATRKYDLRFPRLEQDLDVDVVIIGGGFSGIQTALELAENGVKNVAVLEAKHLGYGGTSRNGGQVMAGIGHDLDAVKRDIGEAGVRAIFALSHLGPKIMRERIARYGIDADFRNGYGYLAYNARQAKTLRAWEQEFKALEGSELIEYVEGSDVKRLVGSNVYYAGLMHMGGGHVHSLNLLLGEAKAASEIYGIQIFEFSPALEVTYGGVVRVRTANGSVKAQKLVWACDGFVNRLEPDLHATTINVFAYNSVTEPLSDEMIKTISPIRGAYSDIRPVINYYRVTNDNRLMFGSSTSFVERTPSDLKRWNHKLMTEVFPYLSNVKMDLAWGGPMASSRNLFPQLGTLENHSNVFFVQGYSGFGVTPSQIICKILAEGILGGSERYNVLSAIPRRSIAYKDRYRALWVSLGKIMHQTSGYWHGRR